MTDPQPIQHLKRYLATYPQAARISAEFRARKGTDLPDWPAWCFLPLAGAANIIMLEAERQGVPLNTAMMGVGNLGAMLAWRQTQGIYRIDPALYDALWTTPLDGNIPVEVLYRMPEWCVWIETPGNRDLNSPGFFAYLEHDIATGRPELRISISARGALSTQILHLTAPDIEGCIEAAYQEGLRQAEKHGVEPSGPPEFGPQIAKILKAVMAPRISLLLYLCTVNSEIRDEKTRMKRPANPEPMKTRKGPKLFPAASPTAWDVGVRIGAAIRAAQDREKSEPQGGTHASPRPHVRRAHWHSFLTGPGRQERVLKWLPPIPINMDDPDLPAVLRDVK